MNIGIVRRRNGCALKHPLLFPLKTLLIICNELSHYTTFHFQAQVSWFVGLSISVVSMLIS